MCPKRHGVSIVTMVYIDSGAPLLDNMWREDDSLAVSCYSPRYTPE